MCTRNLLSHQDDLEREIDINWVKKLQEIKQSNPNISFSKIYDFLNFAKVTSNTLA
ncbi:MAG: hypothetical protein AB8U25_03160 [Rickettsiales endosymbiont of Dermacentor nuttalli]